MIRVLQSLLALISLLLLALMAAKANGATCQEAEQAWQIVPPEPAVSAGPRVLPVHRCLVPGEQPGTHLQGQPFAYGYFGAKARPMAAFHRNNNGDWFQWSVRRAD
ncbi:MAG: hypothetical protein ABSG53_18230 [Thermoguttaceae bacterium]|jgi:hypothetical protein